MAVNQWLPIESAPKDAWIFVLTGACQGLAPIISLCHWHPDAGFCVDELRSPVAWQPVVYPAPPWSDECPIIDTFEWQADCRHWYGVVLRGEFAHYCLDWDGLPIDETCMEFTCCNCFDPSPEIIAIQGRLAEELCHAAD